MVHIAAPYENTQTKVTKMISLFGLADALEASILSQIGYWLRAPPSWHLFENIFKDSHGLVLSRISTALSASQ